jgi:hypothetical protein
MGKSDEVLKQFVSKKSIYFDLPDGQEEIVRYLGADSVTTVFKGQNVDSIRYQLEHDGVIKFWDRTSRQLAKQMSQFGEGSVLKIKRTGERNHTKYEIEKVE